MCGIRTQCSFFNPLLLFGVVHLGFPPNNYPTLFLNVQNAIAQEKGIRKDFT